MLVCVEICVCVYLNNRVDYRCMNIIYILNTSNLLQGCFDKREKKLTMGKVTTTTSHPPRSSESTASVRLSSVRYTGSTTDDLWFCPDFLPSMCCPLFVFVSLAVAELWNGEPQEKKKKATRTQKGWRSLFILCSSLTIWVSARTVCGPVWRCSLTLKAFLTHVVLMVVRSPGHGRAGGVRGDDRLPVALQAVGEIPQHGGVSHWRELVVTCAHKHTGSTTRKNQSPPHEQKLLDQSRFLGFSYYFQKFLPWRRSVWLKRVSMCLMEEPTY